MESFAKLKRRTTDLMNSLPQNLPNMPHVNMPSVPHIPHKKGGHNTMKGTWQHIDIPALPRSSHSIDVVEGRAYIFGGEVEPRKPVDNDMHVITLPANSAPADYYAVKAKPSPKTQSTTTIPEEDELRDPLTDVPLASLPEEPSASEKGKENATPQVPRARIGHATAVIGTRIFLFGGRSATETSSTLDEQGRVWIFETKTNTWAYADPYRTSPVPPARSYFAAVATDKPRNFEIKPLRRAASWKEWAEGDSAEVGIPQRPIPGSVAAHATDEEDAGFGTFIIHGGCLAGGERAADVWAFDVRSATWKELPPAPGPARGGPALAIAKSRLYRFGGFDGTAEQGGQLDVLALGLDEFDDRASKGEIGVFARGGWESLVPPTPAAPPAQGGGDGEETGRLVPTGEGDQPWPGNRSVASMELVFGGQGREYLVLMLGERDPSAAGHAGAGKFWDDVWAFQVPPLGMTAASFTDAVWQAVGRKSGESQWKRVDAGPYDDDEELDKRGPGPRGWLASAPLGDLEEAGVVVFGGLSESNTRLGDAWIFRLG